MSSEPIVENSWVGVGYSYKELHKDLRPEAKRDLVKDAIVGAYGIEIHGDERKLLPGGKQKVQDELFQELQDALDAELGDRSTERPSVKDDDPPRIGNAVNKIIKHHWKDAGGDPAFAVSDDAGAWTGCIPVRPNAWVNIGSLAMFTRKDEDERVRQPVRVDQTTYQVTLTLYMRWECTRDDSE